MNGNFYKLGGGALIGGALIGFIANLIHPRDIDFENTTRSLLQTINDFPAWTPLHFFIIIAVALGVFGIYPLSRSISGDVGQPLARMGLVSGIVGGAIFLIAIGLDGVSAKSLADSYAAAGAESREAVLASAEIFTALSAGISSVAFFLYLGVTFILFGLAIALGEGYPKWLGWIALLAGLVSAYTGFLYYYETRLSSMVINLLTISVSITTIWGLVIGTLLWRKAEVPAKVTAAA